MKTYNLNILSDGQKITLELTTPVENLFDFCSMLQEQMKNGAIPLNAEIHSIVPTAHQIKEKLNGKLP